MKVKLFHRLDNCGFITLQALRFARLERHLMRKKSIITGIRYLCGGKLSTRLYDKRDDFDFQIVNFPFLSSNIPSSCVHFAAHKIIMQHAAYITAHITMILDIATSAWLIDFCHKAI